MPRKRLQFRSGERGGGAGWIWYEGSVGLKGVREGGGNIGVNSAGRCRTTSCLLPCNLNLSSATFLSARARLSIFYCNPSCCIYSVSCVSFSRMYICCAVYALLGFRKLGSIVCSFSMFPSLKFLLSYCELSSRLFFYRLLLLFFCFSIARFSSLCTSL